MASTCQVCKIRTFQVINFQQEATALITHNEQCTYNTISQLWSEPYLGGCSGGLPDAARVVFGAGDYKVTLVIEGAAKDLILVAFQNL